MKILFFTPNNSAGGAERVMTLLSNEFSKKDDIIFVTIENENDFYPLNNKIKRIKYGLTMKKMKTIKKFFMLPIVEIKRILNFNKTINENKPDVVISFLFTTNIISSIVCKLNKIPLIISERNDPNKYSFLKRLVMKVFYNNANAIVCQSNYAKEYALKNYKIKKCAVIPNPITEDQYEKYDENLAKENKIITVGRLVEQKNQKMLINAFNEIKNQCPEYKLYIYGEGYLKNDLSKMIKKLNLQNRVFLAGVEKDVIKHNRNATLFVLPSNFEGYPNVLIEAMANGILSIATDFPNVTDIIDDKINGFIVERNNEIQLSSLLLEILKNKEKYKYIESNGTNIVKENDISNVMNLWLKTIKAI